MSVTDSSLSKTCKASVEFLEKTILEKQSNIETWFRHEWHKSPAPFYASIDLRNAGFKLAPVDTNLFPAGFNNLNPDFDPLVIQAIQTVLERRFPDARKVLIVPENHSRNLFYFKNLAKLYCLIKNSGYEVKVATIDKIEDMPEFIPETEIPIEVARICESRICAGDFSPCLVLLNNDLSSGFPEIFKTVKHTILPPPQLGWYSRLKSTHFGHYSDIAAEFADMIDIDPWLIDPFFEGCGEINFMDRSSDDAIEEQIATMLSKIQKKYAEYDINKDPFVVVKADSGTYGMGVISVKKAEDITALNRKQRKKMAFSKGNNAITNVLIQEGVYTNETVGGDLHVAEPVIYHIDHYAVGGFYRVHKDRSEHENLNAPGAHFEPLPFSKSCINPDCKKHPNAKPNRFYTYGVISRLALLAAAREINAVKKES